MKSERFNHLSFPCNGSPGIEKKTRSCAGTRERVERHLKQRPSTPLVYHSEAPASSRIEGFIPHGAENAVTTRELSRLTGLHPRRVTLAVETARLDGVLICSSSRNGYFLPVTRSDVRRCIHALRRRLRHQARTLAAMERALARAENLLP